MPLMMGTIDWRSSLLSKFRLGREGSFLRNRFFLDAVRHFLVSSIKNNSMESSPLLGWLAKLGTCRGAKHENINASEIFSGLAKLPRGSQCPNTAGFVFSMDRAAQLDALLFSYQKNVIGPPLHVLYRATSIAHHEAYNEVFQIHGKKLASVVAHSSREDFRRKLLGMLREIRVATIFFLVDDNVFIEPVDINFLAQFASPFAIPSLRLGLNIETSYTHRAHQPQPKLAWLDILDHQDCRAEDRLFTWTWAEGKIDWGYPMSLDGNLFMFSEVMAMLEVADFSSPNTLEVALQNFNSLVSNRLGLCFEKSRLLNIPANRVQNEINNFHGNIHQDQLLEMWKLGWRLDVSRFQGIRNTSAHQELEIFFRRRETWNNG